VAIRLAVRIKSINPVYQACQFILRATS